MSSVGVFRKVEMDEKSYWVHTLTQTDNAASSGEAAIDSGGDDLPLQPFFSCPAARVKSQDSKLDPSDNNCIDEFLPFESSPHFSSTRTGDQQGERSFEFDHYDICKLPVVHLYWCNNKVPNHYEEFECSGCRGSMVSTSYYTCLECEKTFHKECVESPLEIRHPSHPFHPLQLTYHLGYMECTCCGAHISFMFYHCTTCELRMHPICAMRTIPFVEDHPKSHPHPLTYFPTQASLVCLICAQIKNLDPTYICVQCVFVIHKDCIGYPHVIRISRHQHRISFTLSLPPGKWACGVCRQQVDNNYGAYSCSKGEAYFVHSKCAVDRKVWDGIELDGVPEEDDLIDDGEPFKRIADGIILHPFHSHNLRLKIIKAYDEYNYCRGCALPIYEGQFYSCMEMECKFILHQSCASAPRMKRHPLHPYPLTLKVAIKGPDNAGGTFNCSVCGREGTCFFYEHRIGERSFQLDLRCATITEPFEYQGHKHPLFLASDPDNMPAGCVMCINGRSNFLLNCMECDYVICFGCVTFPYKVKYKHDSHFLTICDGKEVIDQPDWCEACEIRIVENGFPGFIGKKFKFFYKCSEYCCTALHVECLFGENIYMKPGNSIKDCIAMRTHSFIDSRRHIWVEFQILFNNSLSRPSCSQCLGRCPFPIFFKGCNTIYCSWGCVAYSAM